jgi:hypothetical protein
LLCQYIHAQQRFSENLQPPHRRDAKRMLHLSLLANVLIALSRAPKLIVPTYCNLVSNAHPTYKFGDAIIEPGRLREATCITSGNSRLTCSASQPSCEQILPRIFTLLLLEGERPKKQIDLHGQKLRIDDDLHLRVLLLPVQNLRLDGKRLR